MDARAELLAVLSHLYWQTWHPDTIYPDAGICAHVEDSLSGAACQLWRACKREMFPTWRYYSGSLIFPVPGPGLGRVSAEEYYCGGGLWHGRQRMLRRDLLRHIVAEL